jgi:hypothetical protein
VSSHRQFNQRTRNCWGIWFACGPFPAQFGTVDQFAVKALAKIPELPERDLIAAMNPESLKPNEGTILIRIMRRKAVELNRVSSLVKWTPRKVDMVLWTCAR